MHFCNFLQVFWMDWNLTENVILSGGPVGPVIQGEKIRWNKHCKQGVYFFVQRDEKKSKVFKNIEVTLKFQPQDADLSFQFHCEVV